MSKETSLENTDARDMDEALKKLNTPLRGIADRWQKMLCDEESLEFNNKWARAKDALLIEENPDIYGDGGLKLIEDALSNLINDRHTRGDLLAVARTFDDKDIDGFIKHNKTADKNKNMVHFTHLIILSRTNDTGLRNNLLKQIMDPKISLSCQATLALIRDHNAKVNPPKPERPTNRAKQIASKSANLNQVLDFDDVELIDSVPRIKTADLPKARDNFVAAKQTLEELQDKLASKIACIQNGIEEVQQRLALEDARSGNTDAEDQSSAKPVAKKATKKPAAKKKAAAVTEEAPAGGPAADIKKRLRKLNKRKQVEA